MIWAKHLTGDSPTGHLSRALLIALAGLLFTGCGKKAEPAQVSFGPYEKKEHPTDTVKKGDLKTIKEKVIPAKKQMVIFYKAKRSDLKKANILVSVGQKVKKGELLLEFTSEELEEEIAAYQKQIRQNRMALSHCQRQEKITPGQEYKDKIRELKQQSEVAGLYLKQALEKKQKSRVLAKRGGRITEIDASLTTGEFDENTHLITQVCGKEQAERVIKTPGPVLRQVVYVSRDAIWSARKGQYVYRLGEDGYRRAVWVTTGKTVKDQIVITSGLSGKETVVIKN